MANLMTANEQTYGTAAIARGGLIGGQSAEIAERVAKGEITVKFNGDFCNFYADGNGMVGMVERETIMPRAGYKPVPSASFCDYLPEAFERYLENRIEANRAARLAGGVN